MNPQWMIHPSCEPALFRALNAEIDAAAFAKLEPTAAEPVDVIDGVARVAINGVLLNQRERFLDFFGVPQTSYADISAQLREAAGAPEVRAIELQVDSGGGQAGNALLATSDLIASIDKPITAVVGDMAASAAYWLASQADEVVLSGRATWVGSIGVAVDTRVSDSDVSITSTDAPNKRPDLRTDAGRAVVRGELDDLHALFVESVARGRGVTADVVNRDFGKGGSVLAEEAVRVGMADRVLSAGTAPSARDTIAAMDLDSFCRNHPDLYAEVVGIGAMQERQRVQAHLNLAKASGAMDAAIGHIEAGRGVDDLVIADHHAAAITASQQTQREAAAPPAIAPVAPTSTESAEEAEIRATFAELGVENF